MQVDKDKEAASTKALAQTLFDTALLESGFGIEHPQDFNQRVHRLMADSLGLKGSLDGASEVSCTSCSGLCMRLQSVVPLWAPCRLPSWLRTSSLLSHVRII